VWVACASPAYHRGPEAREADDATPSDYRARQRDTCPVPCPARARGPTHRLGSLAAPGVVGSGQDDAIEIGPIVLIERPGAGKVATTQVALLGLLPSLPLP